MSSADENPEDVKERKRRERLEQNRISARESRKRKKTMIEELQRTVIGLSRDNKDLNDRNESLRRQLMDLGTKVRKHTTKATPYVY
jgi:bZIP transcription factor.